jgi:hypothetical protein
MAGKTFQGRLQACQRAGNLTVSDLARWFDRARPTVRTWVESGIEPGRSPADIEHAHALLGLLEVLIHKKKGFPVPRLSPQKRIEHLQHIRAKALP